MVYDTYKPLNLSKSVLYYSKTKWLTKEQDSVVLNSHVRFGAADTITFDTTWKYPVYLTLRLYFKDKVRTSNIFYFAATNPVYNVLVSDASLKVSQNLSNSFSTQSSLNGLALVLHAIIEMILAWLISKVFGISRRVVLMVLAANIAAFPLYMIGISSFLVRELLVFIVKAVIMILIGWRKIPVYKVLLLLAILTVVGMGFKEFFFFVARLI